MKKIGIFIGQFDPIHSGHIEVAMNCIRGCNLEFVWFFPLTIYHHAYTQGRMKNFRENLISKISNKHLGLITDTRNATDRSISNILIDFQESPANKDYDIHFIIGTDVANRICTWGNWGYLIRNLKFLIHPRPDSKLKQDSVLKVTPHIYYIGAKQNPINSYDIRLKARGGHKISHLVPSIIAKEIYDAYNTLPLVGSEF